MLRSFTPRRAARRAAPERGFQVTSDHLLTYGSVLTPASGALRYVHQHLARKRGQVIGRDFHPGQFSKRRASRVCELRLRGGKKYGILGDVFD